MKAISKGLKKNEKGAIAVDLPFKNRYIMCPFSFYNR
jgi:hypothetical protein